MRPNLSVEKIAGALAVLGTSVMMAACGGDKPANTPVNSNEVKPADGKAAGGGESHCGADKQHKDGQSSCGGAKAGGSASCGAGKGGESGCGAKTGDPPKADSNAAGTPTTGAAAGSGADATPTTAPAPSSTSTTKKPDPKAPAKPGTPGGGKKSGAASCGAGTCSAKK